MRSWKASGTCNGLPFRVDQHEQLASHFPNMSVHVRSNSLECLIHRDIEEDALTDGNSRGAHTQ